MATRIVLFCLFLTVSGCATDLASVGETVTVYRGEFGTPHVVAESNRGVFYGYGYAVATDRLFQMEMLKRTVQGRVAQVLGPDFLSLDEQLRSRYDHRAVRQQLAQLPAPQKAVLQAYADGFNARLQEVQAAPQQLLPAEFATYDFLPQPWTAYDVAMIFVGSIAHRYSDFNSERDNLALLQHLQAVHGKAEAWRIFNASKWLLDDSSPTTVPATGAAVDHAMPIRPAYLDELPAVGPSARLAYSDSGRFAGLTSDPTLAAGYRQQLAISGFSHHPEFAAASNFWAVQGLDDARAALVNGPQFGFSTPSYVYGIGLHGGDFNAVGSTLLGLPALLFAHNNHIAWGSTAGMSDQSDEYALSLDPRDSSRYRQGDGWQHFQSWPETIMVKGADSVTVTARRAVQGMVQLHDPQSGVAWVRARAWEGHELETLMAWIFLATDKSLDEAQQRVGAMATNINIYTMDRQGNIAYTHSGRYPLRAAGHDPRLPVPGSGRWDWQGMRPYADNPAVRNPQQGFIANWNNRPARDWIASDLWSYTWGRADRGGILLDLLRSQERHSVADVSDVNRQTSYIDVNAPFMLPYLFSAWAGVEQSAQTASALAVLRQWSGLWQADASGHYGAPQALMEAWLRTLLRDTILDDVGADNFHLYAATNYPNNPAGASIGTAPGTKALLRNLDALRDRRPPDFDFFNGREPAAVIRRSFSRAVQALTREQGDVIAQWRLRASPMRWQPFNFRGVPQALPDAAQQLPAYLNRGSENNVFVATGRGIEARDVIPPGQTAFIAPSGEAGPHNTDQLQLFADFAYKAVPFTPAQVRAGAVEATTLTLPRLQ